MKPFSNFVPPERGGCWYCHKADRKVLYSENVQTNVHADCIKKKIKEDPDNEEAQAFVKEFNLLILKE